MLTILATVDGSSESIAVIPAVEKLALDKGAQVRLITVVERPAPTRRQSSITRSPTAPAGGVPGAPESALGTRSLPDTRLAETDDQAIARIEAEAQEFLDRSAKPLRDRGIDVSTECVMAENPAGAIIEYAREHDFDLIAMATHGRGGLTQLVQGSVASAVVKSGVAPVMLIRPSKA
jgi:nucleotide-binding universal stress UspA family protein